MYLVGKRGRLQNGFVCYNIKPLPTKKSFMETLKKHAKKTQAVPQRSPEMPPYSQEYQGSCNGELQETADEGFGKETGVTEFVKVTDGGGGKNKSKTREVIDSFSGRPS
ncbi:hypothetical protein DAPPUDRAFT_114376 [Daphnia pulex]|uniref:Uncharacterized protein n=1 Tax=Daphnia pulex TaxID=6669 RepID=E9HHY1_DAPPU|nr:hypothetical protein DAPPUDRAFT_114376 [Daphnia pulex]|eukprot:EFX68628.1 hypothetical protein DAPPUDRAFT_114376 [Daphnia pulex]